ncbi:Tetratricopeptide repeat-containing protein [Nannocystis exedens]|uniref:Tetratricopeptide repeat-containing protein n=2 Tax=Nannocystis exedens TaxID=54 RepID=A0A1I2FSC0_9BACT|nr:hypothetical protein NAEX_06788 [Nannocystis exedens]SFF08324.1 Tetratricopeptide repeat-containing protein [Nannocystis exedens]
MSQQQHRSAQRRAEKRHRREVERRRARTSARKEDSVRPDRLRRLAGDDLVPSVDEETVVHPYLSHRYRERELLVRGTPWRWRREMPGFWTHAEVAALADDALFAALAERGLVVSRTDVLAHIARMPAGGSAWRMSRIHWLPAVRSRSLPAPDRDFLGLAAVELWRRLRPEDPPLESLLAILADAEDLPDDDRAGQLAGLIRFLAAVRARGGPDDAGEVSGVRLPLGGPYTRMVILAFRLVEKHPQLAADVLAEAEHWAEHTFVDEYGADRLFLGRMLVLVCVELGREDDAERRLRALLAQFPGDPATRRLLAVQLHENPHDDRSRLVEALELWDSTRSAGDEPEDDDFQQVRDEIAESLRLHDAAGESAAAGAPGGAIPSGTSGVA